MDKVERFGRWIGRWFTVLVILWAAFNYFLPRTSLWVVPNTPYLLGIILFGMGLTLRLEDFERIIKRCNRSWSNFSWFLSKWNIVKRDGLFGGW
jgi:BASS family bile acid:Na+ symporter